MIIMIIILFNLCLTKKFQAKIFIIIFFSLSLVFHIYLNAYIKIRKKLRELNTLDYIIYYSTQI